jgi:hypothetical protein
MSFVWNPQEQVRTSMPCPRWTPRPFRVCPGRESNTAETAVAHGKPQCATAVSAVFR